MRVLPTEFARPRLFPREPRPNTIQDVTPGEFERHLNEHRPLLVAPSRRSVEYWNSHANWR